MGWDGGHSQVDQLLELKVVRLHALDNIVEQGADILANRHRSNHLRASEKRHNTSVRRARADTRAGGSACTRGGKDVHDGTTTADDGDGGGGGGNW
jgi:hypothetical protein